MPDSRCEHRQTRGTSIRALDRSARQALIVGGFRSLRPRAQLIERVSEPLSVVLAGFLPAALLTALVPLRPADAADVELRGTVAGIPGLPCLALCVFVPRPVEPRGIKVAWLLGL